MPSSSRGSDCLSSLCLPYSPKLTHASLSGDLLKMSQSTVLCHIPRPLIMPFIKKTIPSELTPPHTFTMPNKMKAFHKHWWDEQMGSLDCIYALRGILQGYWKMLNLNNPWTHNADYLLHCTESSSDTAHLSSVGVW